MAYGILIDGTPTDGANPWIDSLVWGGAWTDADGGKVTINYAVQTGYDPYGVFAGSSLSWSAAALGALGKVISSWEAVANIDFVQTAPATADAWFWVNTDSQVWSNLGYSEVPAYDSTEPLYLMLNGQDSSWNATGLQKGGFAYVTILHEMGHLLGLAHPHDGGSAWDATLFPGVTAAFDSYGTYNLNQGIFTTMSYNDGWATRFPGHGALGYGYQATPMALDIAAIQAIYGANTTFASGNNTYALPKANTAGAYWSCIWDTGGTDTVSNAGGTLACTIDLRAAPLTGPNAGGWVSWNAGIVGGFTIANGVKIENALGGSGADRITGNIYANRLDGAAGNDTIWGGGGNDTIVGGTGADTMLGGAGNDVYLADNVGEKIFETTTQTSTVNAGGTDLVQSSVSLSLNTHAGVRFVENLTLTGTANLNGTGNGLANTLTGNGGANTLSGLSGNDVLRGNGGADRLIGGLGVVQLYAGVDSQRDVFVFDDLHTGTGAARDSVFNFVSGIDDLDLGQIDADSATAGDDGFAFGGAAAGAHSVWLAASGADVIVFGDVNGDAVADFEIRIAAIGSLGAGDFVL